MKSFLFIMRHPPHSGIQLQEKLDVILTTAAFEQKIALLFLDDGVFQLKKDQYPDKQQLKNTLSIFNALEIYDVNDLYVEADSLQERGLKLDDLSLPVEALYCKDINALMAQFDLVLG